MVQGLVKDSKLLDCHHFCLFLLCHCLVIILFYEGATQKISAGIEDFCQIKGASCSGVWVFYYDQTGGNRYEISKKEWIALVREILPPLSVNVFLTVVYFLCQKANQSLLPLSSSSMSSINNNLKSIQYFLGK